MAYSIQIFKKNWTTQRGTDGRRARTLTHATDISVRQDLNAPRQITFQVPRGSDDAKVLEIGYVVRVLDGTTRLASGVIVGPLDKTRPMIPVTVAGKEEILNWSITPYEFQLESDTAEGQVRELLNNYRFFRQNTPAEFNAGTLTNTEVLTVAADPDEYFVTLKETNEVYDASGTYLSQPILCTDDKLGVPSDISRLRYLAELGNETEISVAFRYSYASATRKPRNWSTWSSEYPLTTENTEKLGITEYSISANFRWIQVRFTLSTSDTSITPALQAFEIICEYPCEITAGNINLPGPKLAKTFSFASHHQAIREIVSARNAEFKVNDDYELEIAERFGAKTATQTFEVGKNCNVVQFQQQDRRLSTEIWSLGEGKGIAQQLLSVDASDTAVANYGARPWVYRPIATDDTQRTQEIADELARRDTPTLHVTLDEIAATPLSVDIGDTVNFLYARRNINTTLRVIRIRAADKRKGQPRQFELISNEGFFYTEPEPEEEPREGETGETGEAAAGTEEIYAVTNVETIPSNQEPDNDWGYNQGGTRGGLSWQTTPQSVSETHPNQFVSTRQIIGSPADGETGDAIDSDWSTPTLFSTLGKDAPLNWGDVSIEDICYGDGSGNLVQVRVRLNAFDDSTRHRMRVEQNGNHIKSLEFRGTTDWSTGRISSGTVITWDGTNDTGNEVPIGNYQIAHQVIYIPLDIRIDRTYNVVLRKSYPTKIYNFFLENGENIVRFWNITNPQKDDLELLEIGDTLGFFVDGIERARASISATFISETIEMRENGKLQLAPWLIPPPTTGLAGGTDCIIRTTRSYPPEDGETGETGEAAAGTEEIYAVTNVETIPSNQNPDNDWGYNQGGTRGGLTWQTTPQSVSETHPNQFISTRQILGAPADGETGDAIDGDWSTPALIRRYAGDGETGETGEAAVGTEYLYAVTNVAAIPNSQLPSNAWGYDQGGTRGRLSWQTTPQSVSETKPNQFITKRQTVGTPSSGDTIDDNWSTPSLFSTFGEKGDGEGGTPTGIETGRWKYGIWTKIPSPNVAERTIVHFSGAALIAANATSFTLGQPEGQGADRVYGVVTALPQIGYNQGFRVPVGYIDGNFIARFGVSLIPTFIHFVGQYELA